MLDITTKGKIVREKAFFCVLFLLVFSMNSFALTKGFQVLEETATTLRIKFNPNLVGFDTIQIDGDSFLNPKIQGAFVRDFAPNSPKVLYVSELIAIPNPTSFHFSYTIHSFREIKGKIPPSATLNYENDGNRFAMANYLDFHPVEWVRCNYLGIGRNIHLAEILIASAQYDPRKNAILVPNEIEITITFEPSQPTSIIKASDDLMVDVLNPKQAKQWIISLRNTNTTIYEKEKADKLLAENNPFVKIKVEKEGIYKIDASMLSSLGINIPINQVNTIKIYGGTGRPLSERVPNALKNTFNEIPIIVRSKQNGELDYLLFYGIGTQGFEYNGQEFRSYTNPFGNTNYYYLTWGGSEGKRFTFDSVENSTNVNTPAFYIERIFFKEEFINPYASGSGRTWFGGSIFPRIFTNLLSNLERNGDVLYRFNVAHKYRSDSFNLKGVFSFYEASSNLLGKVSLPPISSGDIYTEAKSGEITTSLPAKQIAYDNRSNIRIEYYNPETGRATPFFNFYEIHYPRAFVPIDNTTSFFSNPTDSGCFEYQINGFSGEIFGFDVTIPDSPKQVKNLSVVGSSFTFRANIEPNKVRKFFISSNTYKPEVTKINLRDLRTMPLNADVVIITNKLLRSSAENYKQYREKTTNLSYTIVYVDEIFDEFSYGIPDPTGIRDFLAFALYSWEKKPKYVLLWGDGHYDYKNITTKNENYVPTYESSDAFTSYNGTNTYASDDYLAYIAGDDQQIDVAIARVPVYDDQAGNIYVNKIETYESNSEGSSWRATMILAADDGLTKYDPPQSDGNLHTRDSEVLSREKIPPMFFQRKVYLPEYPLENIPGGRRKPQASADLVQTINNGGILVNWVGHGNPRVWAHEELFDRDKTVGQLVNKNKLFFGIAATCDFGRFDMTEIRSGTEELLFSPKGGAIGYFTATRLVYVSDNAAINQEFVEKMFERNSEGKYSKIGDVYFKIKQYRHNDNDKKYLLFGDPLITLNMPEYNIVIKKVNGTNVGSLPTDSLITFKAMSKLQIEGAVASPLDSSTVSHFNGIAEIVVNDVDYIKEVKDIDPQKTSHYIAKTGGILAKGIVQVINGEFSTEFYIPEEISYLPGNISLRVFAKDTSGKYFALGYFNKMKINGVDVLSVDDDVPPKVEIFLNDTTFREGDIVSNPPMLILRLWDNYGINATGRGIGHRIEAWIDNNIESIDLTDKYESSLTNPKQGYAKSLIYGLEPGEHKIRARAWDIFNNYTVAETKFRILGPEDGIKIYNLSTYPNPASGALTFRFQHNTNGPFRITLEVFSIFGNLVYSSVFEESKLLRVELPWNCLDNSGNSIPSGIYSYSVTVESSGSVATAFGKFAIVK